MEQITLTALQGRVFRKENGDLFSQDLAMSFFALPLAFAKAEDVNVKRYPKFPEGMKKSVLSVTAYGRRLHR